MKSSLFLLLVLLSFESSASLPDYYPSEYRNEIQNGLYKNEDLKKVLFRILTKTHKRRFNQPDTLVETCPSGEQCFKHRALSYSEARSYLFGRIHLESDDRGHFVKDVYCEKDYRRSDGVGPMRIPNHNLINCEHTWPQSRFTSTFSRETQKTDLNHLYPTDNRANSIRGNHPFAEVYGESISRKCSNAYIGSAETPEKRRSGISFEPPSNHKGNVARALFYFAVRYKMKISAMEEAHLRNWHELDPVNDQEISRNNIIEEVQGNRNPFIDMPELVNEVSDF
jgi:deoxyribonuclease I